MQREAAVRNHGVGQRTADGPGAAEAYLAGQVKVLPTMLNNRSLLDMKPAFCVSLSVCVCACQSSLSHSPSLFCTIFHSENHTELN